MKRIMCWGTGYVANQVMNECLTICNYKIMGFIDNDEDKVGHSFFGRMIYSPCILNEIAVDVVVILTDSYDEIKKQIESEYPQITDKVKNRFYFYKESILKRYKNTQDEEIKEIVSYIEHNDIEVFNYQFKNKYTNMPVNPVWDKKTRCIMFYIMDTECICQES